MKKKGNNSDRLTRLPWNFADNETVINEFSDHILLEIEESKGLDTFTQHDYLDVCLDKVDRITKALGVFIHLIL